jgi:hypothetical protein
MEANAGQVIQPGSRDSLPILYIRHMEIRMCHCGSGLPSRELSDAQGIYIGRVCDRCERATRAHYRPEIFSGYDQDDVDEPIEPDD